MQIQTTYTLKVLKLKGLKISSAATDMQQLEIYIADDNVKWDCLLGKQFGNLLSN